MESIQLKYIRSEWNNMNSSDWNRTNQNRIEWDRMNENELTWNWNELDDMRSNRIKWTRVNCSRIEWNRFDSNGVECTKRDYHEMELSWTDMAWNELEWDFERRMRVSQSNRSRWWCWSASSTLIDWLTPHLTQWNPLSSTQIFPREMIISTQRWAFRHPIANDIRTNILTKGKRPLTSCMDHRIWIIFLSIRRRAISTISQNLSLFFGSYLNQLSLNSPRQLSVDSLVH